MTSGVLGEAEGYGECENSRGAGAPQHHGKRCRRRIEQRHAAGQRRHDEGDEPAVAPGLDQKRLGDPIESGEEIAEAEPEPSERRASQPLAKRCVARMATVEQPHEQAEA